MLGNPVAVVAEFVAALRERQGVGHGVARVLAAGDRGLVENAESDGQYVSSSRCRWFENRQFTVACPQQSAFMAIAMSSTMIPRRYYRYSGKQSGGTGQIPKWPTCKLLSYRYSGNLRENTLIFIDWEHNILLYRHIFEE